MKFNDVVLLFNPVHRKQVVTTLDRVLKSFCEQIGVRDWDSFKNSNKIKQFKSSKLNKTIPVHGNMVPVVPEYGWSADELEFVFKKNVKTEELRRLDAIKEAFGGVLVI
jgi:hypothetical protein